MLPTASKLHLARVCPPAFVLDHLDIRTAEAEAGVERHADYEWQIQNGQIPEALASRWPGFTWLAEVAFAFDYAAGTGRILGIGLKRDYSSARPTEICGTADVVGVSGDPGKVDRLVVLDWKSFEEVERAAVNAQLHIAALALSREYGVDAAEVAIHYEARAMDVAALDAFDLETFASDVRSIVVGIDLARATRAKGASLVFVEGAHCKRCPAYHSCPTKQQLVKDVEARVEQVATGKLLFALDDDDEAAAAYEFADRVAQLLGQLRGALAMRGKERPIPLRNGKMYGLVPKKGNDKLDADLLYKLVREKHGQGIADAAVVRSATKKRLGEALAFAGVANKAGAERELLKELRAQGGIKNEEKQVLDEYEPDKALAAGGER